MSTTNAMSSINKLNAANFNSSASPDRSAQVVGPKKLQNSQTKIQQVQVLNQPPNPFTIQTQQIGG